MYFLMYYIMRCMVSDCLSFRDVKTGHWMWVLPAWSIQTFPVNLSPNSYWWWLPRFFISLGVSGWWFSNSIIPSVFISWNSSKKNSLLSPWLLWNTVHTRKAGEVLDCRHCFPMLKLSPPWPVKSPQGSFCVILTWP